MAKRKLKSVAPLIPPETTKVEVIPQDLKDQWGAVQACATAFSCLDKGTFAHTWHTTVKASLQFLAKLHEQSVELCMKHPQAHMIPELKEEIKKAKEAKNEEQAQTTN